MSQTVRVLLVATLLCFLGCSPSPKSSKGFTLPDGDVEAGKAAYVSLQCNACHRISGIDQAVAVEGKTPIALGGEVARIKTYGELVTAIINPSHKLAKGFPVDVVSVDGESKMRNYNDAMTVTQLTDLVAFLQSKYELLKYDSTDYPDYGPYF